MWIDLSRAGDRNRNLESVFAHFLMLDPISQWQSGSLLPQQEHRRGGLHVLDTSGSPQCQSAD